MASPRSLLNIALAGASVLGAWKAFRNANGKFGQLRALIGVASALALAYGVMTNRERSQLY